MKAGQESAFAEFYDRFASDLFSIIYAILGDRKESEETLREALILMWKRIRTYDPKRASLMTWAVMISRYTALDRLRSGQRRSGRSEAVAMDARKSSAATISPGSGAEVGFLRDDERARVMEALGQLSDAERKVIDRAFFSGLTLTQLAQELGLPSAAVKAGIRHAMLVLRAALKQART